MSETTTTTEMEERNHRGVKLLSGFVSLVGAWIVISSFLYEITAVSYWNNVIVGLAIFLVAGYNYYRMSQDLSTSVGSVSFVALLGLWMLVTPFVFDAGSQAVYWSNIVSGALTAIVGGYNAYEGRRLRAGAAAGTQ